MKVLHLVNHVEDTGNGVVNCAVDLACAQSALGHEVVVGSGGGEFEDLLARNNVAHVPLEQRVALRDARRAAGGLRRAILEADPGVIHTHMVSGTLLAWVSRPRSTPIVASVQNVYKWHEPAKLVADRVIVPTRTVFDRRPWRWRRGRIRAVMNGPLGSPRRAAASDPPAALVKPAVVSVAGLYRRKGIGVLMESLAMLRGDDPPHLYILGDGPDLSLFQEQAHRLGVAERVHFEGFKSHPAPYVEGADLFVLASLRETQPLVVLEAREAGCAIVATDVDGTREALDIGEAGLLVPPGSPSALATAIDSLLTNEASRERLGAAATRRLDYWRTDRVAAEVLDVYRELVQTAGR